MNILLSMIAAFLGIWTSANSPVSSSNLMVIEDFNSSTVGQFPKNWGWIDALKVRPIKDAKDGEVPYKVMEEGGNKFLRADDTGQAVTIVSDKKWNIKKYPCIRWRWRVHQFPTGANERVGGKSDSPASLYVTYYVNFIGVPKSIKYLWSVSNPECDVIEKEGRFKPVMFVAESGTAKKGVWVTETLNVYEMYKKVFGEYPPDETAGIAIRTDADGTKTRAIADYDDIVVLSECDGKCK